MKIFILALSLIFIATASHSQIKSGTIVYEVSTQAMDSAIGIQTEKTMFPGSKLHIAFTPNKTSIKFELAQGFTITSIVDVKRNKGLKTFQSEKGNYAIPCSAEEAKMSFDADENVKVKLTKEKKKILNYPCRKAIVITDSSKTIYWYTKKLSIDFSGQKILTTKLPGFPLSFTTISDGIETTFTAIKLEDEITNLSIFSTDVPEGYIVNESGF